MYTKFCKHGYLSIWQQPWKFQWWVNRGAWWLEIYYMSNCLTFELENILRNVHDWSQMSINRPNKIALKAREHWLSNQRKASFNFSESSTAGQTIVTVGWQCFSITFVYLLTPAGSVGILLFSSRLYFYNSLSVLYSVLVSPLFTYRLRMAVWG